LIIILSKSKGNTKMGKNYKNRAISQNRQGFHAADIIFNNFIFFITLIFFVNIPGEGKRMVESNDLFIKYPESISVVYQLAVMAWLMVLAMSDLNPKILLVSQMMMQIAHLYPQYLLISKEWYSNIFHDIRVLFLTVLFIQANKKVGENSNTLVW